MNVLLVHDWLTLLVAVNVCDLPQTQGLEIWTMEVMCYYPFSMLQLAIS